MEYGSGILMNWIHYGESIWEQYQGGVKSVCLFECVSV